MSDELWQDQCKQATRAIRSVYDARNALFPVDTRSTEERMAKAQMLADLLFSNDFEVAAGACLLFVLRNVELDDVAGGVDGALDLRILEGFLKVLADSSDFDMLALTTTPVYEVVGGLPFVKIELTTKPDREMIADALFDYFKTTGVKHGVTPIAIQMIEDALELERSRTSDLYVVRKLETIIDLQWEQYDSNNNLPRPEDLE